MAVVFTVLPVSDRVASIKLAVAMASADPAVTFDPLTALGATTNPLLKKILSETVASDGLARCLLGLREASEASSINFPADDRIRARLVAETVGVMPQLTAVRDAGTGRAFLQVTAGTTSGGATAVTKAFVELEVVLANCKPDGSAI